MKEFNLLVWLTQLGLSVALPLAGFVFLALWLRANWGWGDWVIWAGLLLGFVCAVLGFLDSLKAMERMHPDRKKKEEPPVSFNEHT